MTRQWKPGDVAVVNGNVALVWQDDNSTRPTFVFSDEDGDPCSVWVEAQADARPLVVIDPEDENAVRDLWQSLANNSRVGWRSMQTALRTLLTPPRPGEPQGLGAVVEDEDGVQWVRMPTWSESSRFAPWASADETQQRFDRKYADIAVTKILSEGVR